MVESLCSFCQSVIKKEKRINPDYIRKDYDNMHDETAWTGHYAVGVE